MKKFIAGVKTSFGVSDYIIYAEDKKKAHILASSYGVVLALYEETKKEQTENN